jgi:uncharacterized membrane protein YvbJ
MYCKNCGAANDAGAKFCANCGTTLGAEPTPVQYQQPQVYPSQAPVPSGNSLAKNIGIGCLITIAIVFFVGLSCTRACFGMRRATHVLRRI